MRTDLGLAVRATGENEAMIRSLGVDTDRTKLVGLAISNGAIALSGALVAQNHGFADIGMGIGILVTGAAAVMIGEAMFGDGIDRCVGSSRPIVGVLIYRLLVALALRVGLRAGRSQAGHRACCCCRLALPRLRARLLASGADADPRSRDKALPARHRQRGAARSTAVRPRRWRAGDFVTVIGSNGAGKSTLLKAIAGL